MTDVAGAFTALRARAESQSGSIAMPMKFQDEKIVLPDTPAAFVYFELTPHLPTLASFGAGRGANRYRNPADLNAFVFVPIGQGALEALTAAERVAAVFRSFRDADVSCFEASVHPVGKGAEIVPDGLRSAAGNYTCAVAIVALFFDQIG